ncbi:MAG: hypothetical protein CMD14_02305 [Flavobacteriales bacterium]|nr:hypothetical protein [Flavobacteriales bacterium]
MLGLNKISYNQDLFFVLIVISLFLISLIKGVYWKHARLLFMGTFAQRYANQYLREENVFTERVNFLTFLLLAVNITLIITKLKSTNEFWMIIKIFCSVLLFYFVKVLIIKLIGILFKNHDLAKLTVFFSLLFDKTFAFILFPIIIGLYFFIIDISMVLLFVSLVVFIIIFIFKLFWLWRIGVNSFGLFQTYIFLYLCTLELFPVLLLVKGFFY